MWKDVRFVGCDYLRDIPLPISQNSKRTFQRRAARRPAGKTRSGSLTIEGCRSSRGQGLRLRRDCHTLAGSPASGRSHTSRPDGWGDGRPRAPTPHRRGPGRGLFFRSHIASAPTRCCFPPADQVHLRLTNNTTTIPTSTNTNARPRYIPPPAPSSSVTPLTGSPSPDSTKADQ